MTTILDALALLAIAAGVMMLIWQWPSWQLGAGLFAAGIVIGAGSLTAAIVRDWKDSRS